MSWACLGWLLQWSTAGRGSPQDFAPRPGLAAPAKSSFRSASFYGSTFVPSFPSLMPIKLFDTLARQMRELHPGDPDGVFRFYNCGPTVYAPAHIGNFRTAVVNDVLRRLLELQFPG